MAAQREDFEQQALLKAAAEALQLMRLPSLLSLLQTLAALWVEGSASGA
jgi:hypothetical protein